MGGNSINVLLAEIKVKAKSASARRPRRLPLSAIKTEIDLFQPRKMCPYHTQELVKAIKNHGGLEPLLVLPVGEEVYVIDGHHRLEAYKAACDAGVFKGKIPVTYFEGTVEEAVLEAGSENSKAKLPMTSGERQDYAWKLVRMGGFTKKQIKAAACVSDGQVGNMRRVFKLLGERADLYDRWWDAFYEARGQAVVDMSTEERDLWIEEQAEKYAVRLTKEFGTTFVNNTQVAALAISKHFGRRLEDLYDDLGFHVVKAVPDYDEFEIGEANPDF